MRADAEGYVARIDAALDLVKMSLDWDRALRRLDEIGRASCRERVFASV